MSNFRSVCVFNKSFGLPHSETPQTNILHENRDLSKLRIDLCVEEAGELNDAFTTKNFTEIIDALTDELYVAYGAGSSFGVNLDYLFRYRVFKELYQHTAPQKRALDILTYEKEMDNNLINMTNYKLLCYVLLKTDTFFTEKRVNIINSDDIFRETFNTDEYDNISILLDELHNNITFSIKQLENNKNISSFDGTVNSLVDILYHTYKLGIFLGIDLDMSFDIVHRSNMSKLCISEEEAKQTVENYKLNDKRYNTPEYRNSDNDKYWVVFNRDTGKILKSINYNPADFRELF
jgi:predicted HAD superfamily Cof-like phosphohydrolase